jgi:hypothetical protein
MGGSNVSDCKKNDGLGRIRTSVPGSDQLFLIMDVAARHLNQVRTIPQVHKLLELA